MRVVVDVARGEAGDADSAGGFTEFVLMRLHGAVERDAGIVVRADIRHFVARALDARGFDEAPELQPDPAELDRASGQRRRAVGLGDLRAGRHRAGGGRRSVLQLLLQLLHLLAKLVDLKAEVRLLCAAAWPGASSAAPSRAPMAAP